MILLGDAFPPEKRREHVLKQLVPGCVIRIEVKFPEGTKPKFLVLVAEDDPDYWTFILNSEVNPFIAARPDLLRCQVKLDAANHPFLAHDSHLACHKVWRVRREEVLRHIVSDTSCIKGRISEEVRDQIAAAVKFAKTLSSVEKRQILAALGA